MPKLIEKTLLMDNKIQNIASDLNEAKGSMFLGRGFSYPIALEGALKLKELIPISMLKVTQLAK